jgi:23S rRNA (cytosine1962-C5)-methyltransferase
MLLETFKNFNDFELLDTGHGYRLEKWGEVILARPDPQIIWAPSLPDSEWNKEWAIFENRGTGNGKWEILKPLPDPWVIQFNNTRFLLKLSPFKHTGLFAEQAANWEWMTERLKMKDERLENSDLNHKSKILNLFAYTGGATMVLAKAGSWVTHVDASKPSTTWANENAALNNLPKDSVRWILDDCAKFVKREIKRGVKYDGIIMDPPAFGHSPSGKTWKFNENLPGLLADCVQLLSDDAKFLIINGYATNSSALALNNLLEDAIKSKQGKIEFGELCLKHPIPQGYGARKTGRIISTGIFSRWSAN